MAERVGPFAWNPNIGAVNGFGIRLNGITYSADVAATTDTVLTIPDLPSSGRTQSAIEGKNLGYAILEYENDGDCWVATNEIATPSLTAAFVAGKGVLRPECVLVYEGDQLHFYSVAGCAVSVTIFPWA